MENSEVPKYFWINNKKRIFWKDLAHYKYDRIVQLSQRFLYKLLSTKSTVFSRAAKSLVWYLEYLLKHVYLILPKIKFASLLLSFQISIKFCIFKILITQDSCITHREVSRMAPLMRLMARLKWTDEHITVVESILDELIRYYSKYLILDWYQWRSLEFFGGGGAAGRPIKYCEN